MNQQQARQIAWEYIKSVTTNVSSPIEILDDTTIEKPYGWIFFHQLEQYNRRPGPINGLLMGNGPVLVTKSGDVIQFPTAIPVEESIRRCEAGLPLLPRRSPRT